MTPKVSIIIPHYGDRAHDLLKPCLDSIIKFTNLSDAEVIIVANGATDSTREVMNDWFPDFRLIWSDEGLGYTKACNEGVKVAEGEYVILMNNDTVLLEQYPKNAWVDILLRAFWDERMAVAGPMKEFCPWADMHFILFFCAMIRKSVFDKIGLLDEAFTPGIGEDTDFCCRAQLAGYKIMQVPDDDDYRFYDHNKRVGNYPIWHRGTETFKFLGDEVDSSLQGVPSNS